MTQPSLTITVHGASWCPDARRARNLLDGRGVAYQWFDIDEDKNSEAFVRKANRGSIRIPVIVFPDSSVLIEPANPELEEKLAQFGL